MNKLTIEGRQEVIDHILAIKPHWNPRTVEDWSDEQLVDIKYSVDKEEVKMTQYQPYWYDPADIA